MDGERNLWILFYNFLLCAAAVAHASLVFFVSDDFSDLSLIMTFMCLTFLCTVFHVTDLNGNKLTDESVIKYIEQVNWLTFNSFNSLTLVIKDCSVRFLGLIWFCFSGLL